MDPLPASPPPTVDPSVRTWTILCHASALLGLLIPAAGHIVGPLIVWLVKRAESPQVDAHGKESLNFQISMFIYTTALSIVTFILMFVLIGFLLVPLFAVLFIADIVLVILACMRASEGQLYRYPLTIRLIK